MYTLEADPKTFQPTAVVRQKQEDGTVSVIHSEPMVAESHFKYTDQELKKIYSCNKILTGKGLDPLTEEEIEYMLDPSGVNKRLENLEDRLEDTETLQRMAGFKVEKKIGRWTKE